MTAECATCTAEVQVPGTPEGPVLCQECDEVYAAWASGPGGMASDHAPVELWIELVQQGKTSRSFVRPE